MTLVLEVILENGIYAQIITVKLVIAKLHIQNVVSIRKTANFCKEFVHISMVLLKIMVNSSNLLKEENTILKHKIKDEVSNTEISKSKINYLYQAIKIDLIDLIGFCDQSS